MHNAGLPCLLGQMKKTGCVVWIDIGWPMWQVLWWRSVPGQASAVSTSFQHKPCPSLSVAAHEQQDHAVVHMQRGAVQPMPRYQVLCYATCPWIFSAGKSDIASLKCLGYQRQAVYMCTRQPVSEQSLVISLQCLLARDCHPKMFAIKSLYPLKNMSIRAAVRMTTVRNGSAAHVIAHQWPCLVSEYAVMCAVC